MKDKSKVLKTYGYMFDKLQFIGLIGGGGFVTRGSSSMLNCMLCMFSR